MAAKLYDGDAGIIGNKPNPGTSIRGRYDPKTHADITTIWLCALVREAIFIVILS
jgi:hypothetical protein